MRTYGAKNADHELKRDEMIAQTVSILVEQIETGKVVKHNAVLPGGLVLLLPDPSYRVKEG